MAFKAVKLRIYHDESRGRYLILIFWFPPWDFNKKLLKICL